MEDNRPLTREEIEDIFDRLHIQEYEWYIDDKEDEHFCSSSEEDAELVEKAIKGLINQYNNDYVSKDKIRKEIEETEKELYNGEILQRFAYIKIETLKELLEE